MDLEKLRQQLEPIFKKHDVILYDLAWKKMHHEKVLEIAIYKKDVPTDIETCTAVSYEVSELLDHLNAYDYPYILDVCSAGIERELKDNQQIQDALYQYVNVKVDHPINNLHVIEGKLSKITDTTIEVLYRDKHKEINATIEKSNIKKIRMAVKV